MIKVWQSHPSSTKPFPQPKARTRIQPRTQPRQAPVSRAVLQAFQAQKWEYSLLEPGNELHIRPGEAEQGEMLPLIALPGCLQLVTFESDI